MSRKRSRNDLEHRSPTETVADATEDLMSAFNIPVLHANVPQRLEDGITARAEALLFALKEAQHERYVHALEVRLVRDAHRVVLTAYELGLKQAEVWYAQLRHLLEALGYERAAVGFSKERKPPTAAE